MWVNLSKSNVVKIVSLVSLLVLTYLVVEMSYVYIYKTLEDQIRDVGSIQASLIESVADFDAQFSTDDYGESARDATLYQINTAFQNFHDVDHSFEFLIVDMSKENAYIYTTESKNMDENTLRIVYQHMNQILDKLSMNEIGRVYIYDQNNNLYLTDYRTINSIDVGLITFIDLSIYEEKKYIIEFIMLLAVILVFGLFTMIYRRVFSLNIDAIRKENESIKKLYNFENHSIWVFDVATDHIDISQSFLKDLKHNDENEPIKTLDDYCSLIHPNDQSNFKYYLNDIMFNNIDTAQVDYRIKNALGTYSIIHSEMFTHDKDALGFPSKIKSMNVMMNDSVITWVGDDNE